MMSTLQIDPRPVLEAIYARRSIRRYTKTPVPRALIDMVLDAARWAPSAHNRQPWRFAVIEAAETKQALAAAMGHRLRRDLEQDGVAPEAVQRDVARSYDRITSAPVVIVACLTMRGMDSYPDERRARAEWTMATQSLAMALQNLLLAAHALGLGACWMCAPLFVPDTVREVLHLEEDWEPQSLITLGFPAEEKIKPRLPVQDTVKYLDSGEE